MARPKNPKNVLEYTCRVTGRKVKTNPKQFHEYVEKTGLDYEVVLNSMVSSGPNGGRRIIAAEGLTPQQAVEKYGLHPVIAHMLKCTKKPVPVAETPTETVVETVIQPESAPTIAMVSAETVDTNVVDDIDDILAPVDGVEVAA
jgi:hypothetical protein